MLITLKCRKCRCVLLNHPESTLLNVHGERLNCANINRPSDITSICSQTNNDVFYIQEVGIPDWIVSFLNEKDWLKGKLNCPGCATRLGSFNFVSGFKCNCKKSVVPPIHIVRSKVDYVMQDDIQNVNIL